MAFSLPAHSRYKLVSNVPFGLTSALLRRLTALTNPPGEAYLVLQLEAAQRWAGTGHETLASVLLQTRFRVAPVPALHRTSFAPRPNVDCVVLKFVRLPKPLVPPAEFRQFEAFVRRGFNGYRPARNGRVRTRPSELMTEDWVRMFRRR